MTFNPMRYKIPLLKRLVPSVKKRWAKLISHNGFFIRKSHGAVFLLNYHNFVDRQIAFYNDFESRQWAVLEEAMLKYGCDLFIDVGANIGYYSVLVAKNALAEHVIAFEPDMRNRYQLEANILMNRLAGKIDIYSQAVSSAAGSVRFMQWPETSTGQSQISKTADGIEVESVCLDDVIKRTGINVFIKMDIEGHEVHAVRGMAKLAAKNNIFLQVECFSDNLESLNAELLAMNLQPCGSIQHDHYYSSFR